VEANEVEEEQVNEVEQVQIELDSEEEETIWLDAQCD